MDEILQKIADNIINPAIVLLFAFALLVFLWGVLQFVRGADNSEARVTGGKHIMYGIIGMAIMISAFGILRFITSSLGIDSAIINEIEK
jgi:hypothetical protein